MAGRARRGNAARTGAAVWLLPDGRRRRVFTGGGIGPLVRSHGLSADYVRSFEVVTGEGVRQRASADECTDLFWGLRGGKGSLGIVTELELELLSLPVFHGGALYFAGVDAPRVLPIWEQACRALPDHTSSSAALLQLPPLPEVPEPLAGRIDPRDPDRDRRRGGRAETFATPLLAAAKPVLGGVGELPYSATRRCTRTRPSRCPRTRPAPCCRAVARRDRRAAGGRRPGRRIAAHGRRAASNSAERWPDPGDRSAFSHRDAVANLEAIGVPVGPQGEAVVAHCPRS